MKNYIISLFLFISFYGFSQENQTVRYEKEKETETYAKFDFGIPPKVNQHAGEINPETGEKESWFLPDGVSLRFSVGKMYQDWIGAGISIGTDWKDSECLIIAPVFGNFRLCPNIGKETRLILEAGYGRSLTINGEHFSGYFKKISLGLEDIESGFGFYLELCDYGFSKNHPKDAGSFILGLNYKFL